MCPDIHYSYPYSTYTTCRHKCHTNLVPTICLLCLFCLLIFFFQPQLDSWGSGPALRAATASSKRSIPTVWRWSTTWIDALGWRTSRMSRMSRLFDAFDSKVDLVWCIMILLQFHPVFNMFSYVFKVWTVFFYDVCWWLSPLWRWPSRFWCHSKCRTCGNQT